MATMIKKYWNSLNEKEKDALIKVISNDNVLRGIAPSFQEWCAVKENTVTLTKEDLRLRAIALFVWGFVFGIAFGVVITEIIMKFTN